MNGWIDGWMLQSNWDFVIQLGLCQYKRVKAQKKSEPHNKISKNKNKNASCLSPTIMVKLIAFVHCHWQPYLLP